MTKKPVGINQYIEYKQEQDQNITTRTRTSSFKFGATNFESIGRFIANIPLPNDLNLNIRTQTIPINVPFLIGQGKFMKNGIKIDFETHPLECRKENWKFPLNYLNGHGYIKPCPTIQNVTSLSRS